MMYRQSLVKYFQIPRNLDKKNIQTTSPAIHHRKDNNTPNYKLVDRVPEGRDTDRETATSSQPTTQDSPGKSA